jgi:hypothetical protein
MPMARTDAVLSVAQPPRTDRLRVLGLLTALSALLLYYFINAIRRLHGDTGDFGHFYYAARAMLDGQDLYTSWRQGYIYPPLLAFLYTPLALLPEDVAAALLLACNIGLLVAAAFLATRELAERFDVPANAGSVCAIVLAGVLLTGDKLRGELQMWQTNILVLFLFVLALRWLDRRPIGAGLVLGLAFNIKYLPLVLLPYLVLRRRWRTAAAFLIGIPAFALLPAVQTGWDVNLRHLAIAYSGLFRLLGIAVEPAQAANIADVRNLLSQSLTSAIGTYRRRHLALWYRPDGAAPGQPLARALTALEWAGLIAAALVFSPQTNSRHFSLLLFVNLLAVLLLLHPRSSASRRPLLLGTAVLGLGLILPPAWDAFAAARVFWVKASGMAWCALFMVGTLLWVGLPDAQGRAAGPRRS